MSAVTPLEALRRLIEATKLIDFADCKDETVWQALASAQGVAEGVLRDFKQEPVAHLRFRAAQSWSGNGNHDVESNEWLEVCNVYDIGDDKLPAFPVYAAPVAAQPAAVTAPDWEAKLYTALDAEFALRESSKRDEDGQRMGLVVDDTQVGVEFAMKWFRENMLTAPQPPISAAAPMVEVEPSGDSIREKFEAWARDNCPFLPNLKGTKSGKQFVYFDIDAQRLWSAFSAAIATTKE